MKNSHMNATERPGLRGYARSFDRSPSRAHARKEIKSPSRGRTPCTAAEDVNSLVVMSAMILMS